MLPRVSLCPTRVLPLVLPAPAPPTTGPDAVPAANAPTGGHKGEADKSVTLHWRRLDHALGGGSSEFHLEGQTHWSAYLTVELEREEQRRTRFEDGHESRGRSVLIGADRWLSTNIRLGIVADIRREEGRPRNGGDFTINSHGLTLYGSFLPDQRGTFIDLSLGISR